MGFKGGFDIVSSACFDPASEAPMRGSKRSIRITIVLQPGIEVVIIIEPPPVVSR
jgi:hypothetical protein